MSEHHRKRSHRHHRRSREVRPDEVKFLGYSGTWSVPPPPCNPWHPGILRCWYHGCWCPAISCGVPIIPPSGPPVGPPIRPPPPVGPTGPPVGPPVPPINPPAPPVGPPVNPPVGPTGASGVTGTYSPTIISEIPTGGGLQASNGMVTYAVLPRSTLLQGNFNLVNRGT